MSSENITPIRKQYLEIKRKHPDKILFFRLGDFYETFDKDAEITSQVLDIVLTSRNVSKGQRVPMAGIPYHAAENYIGKLINLGYHVAICEQVGEQPKRGLFPRQVVRIITPGTLIEPGLLKTDKNNYLVVLTQESNLAGIAYIDITTGEFYSTEFEDDNIDSLINTELARLNPAEILLPESLKPFENHQYHLTYWPDWHFETNRCKEIIYKQFNVATVDGFGLKGKPLATRASGALIQYLTEIEPNALNILQHLSFYELGDSMVLDAATRRNLELTETIRGSEGTGSLLSIIDNTVTPMGKRTIRQWLNKPLINIKEIQNRLDAVEFFFSQGILRFKLKQLFRQLADLERLINRINAKHAIPRDLIALRNTLKLLPEIKKLLDSHTNAVKSQLDSFYTFPDSYQLLESAIVDEPPATLQNIGVIRPGFSTELDQIVQNSNDAKSWISNLEKTERERTGIKSLKVGYNKVFGYYIEISKANASLAPSEYIRKQTLINAERYITPEMKEYEALILNADERIHELELNLFNDICLQLSKDTKELLITSKSIAEIDVLISLAQVAEDNNYCRPHLYEDNRLEIRDGRHPVVERLQTNQLFVPNDIHFEKDEIIRIITGPNMSGKSTFLRQVALIVLLAQIGSFVPASQADIGLVDRIFTRIGAQDEIYAGQSTFMVEMVETANILHNTTSKSLLILDEIGRGTSTYDGLSIAWAVVEYIHLHPQLRARTLFATHFHELTQLASLLPGVRNYNIAVSEEGNQVVFLHAIMPGSSDKSYGIHVAQLAGLPQMVIQRANEVLQQLESSSRDINQKQTIPTEQMKLFPETNPLLEELKKLDLNTMTPLDALNHLHEWRTKFLK